MEERTMVDGQHEGKKMKCHPNNHVYLKGKSIDKKIKRERDEGESFF
jgi:hypothetical protein